MQDLTGFRVAIIAGDAFEQSELTEPLNALKKAGADVSVVAPHPGEIQGVKHDQKGKKIKVDKTFADLRPKDYDGVQLPGGALNADSIRMQPELQEFLRAMQAAGKPMAVICHAPWELISAGLANGRRMTSYYTIQDDVRNAGAEWLDEAVVTDDNLITSRSPQDLPQFNAAMIKLFAQSQGKGTPYKPGRKQRRQAEATA